MKVLGLDPGVTTGWALVEVIDNKIDFKSWGETKDMEMIEIADIVEESDYVVYEEWVTDPRHARRGAFNQNKMPAARVIGSIRTLYRLTKKPSDRIVKQYNHQKPVAYGLAGMKYQKGKQRMHKQDALAHAVFFSVRTLKALPVSNRAS